MLARVPSAVFAPSVPGAPRYSPGDRLACLGVKFLEYSLAGMACGFVGQGVANGLMHIKCAAVGAPPLVLDKAHALPGSCFACLLASKSRHHAVQIIYPPVRFFCCYWHFLPWHCCSSYFRMMTGYLGCLV